MVVSQVWDGTQCKKVRTMGGHQTRTGVLAWSSRILSSGSRDRNILQHDLRVSTDVVSKLVGHKSEVRVQLNPTEIRIHLLLMTKNDNPISILSILNPQVCGLKWSHDDRELASGGNDNQVSIIHHQYSSL